MSGLPLSFEEFLADYQDACGRFDAAAIGEAVAEGYAGDYHYTGGIRRAFDRDSLMAGWRSAAEYYTPAGVRLEYINVAIARREDERVVASWVQMPVRGQETGVSFLVATFRNTPDGWKLVHEHMQHRLAKMMNADR